MTYIFLFLTLTNGTRKHLYSVQFTRKHRVRLQYLWKHAVYTLVLSLLPWASRF